MNKRSNQELASLIIIFVFGYSVMVFLLNHFLKPMMARRVEGVLYMEDKPPEWWENPPRQGCAWLETDPKTGKYWYGPNKTPLPWTLPYNFQKCCYTNDGLGLNCVNINEDWPED